MLIPGLNSVIITLPLLRRTIILVLVVTVISNMQAFDLVYSMTLGGPGEATRVLMLNIYETGFRHLRMGYALAQAMVLIRAYVCDLTFAVDHSSRI